jgi:hypothetical protein
MSFLHECEQFLSDLILGDFNENQMVSAQIVGGLISLIPVVDQVMDVRDVSGCLFRIHKGGGFAKAGIDQKINLGFAAFGVVPEIGSAFKTVFKPLYKERKAMKGAFNGGVAMIERMLGHKKGGAVKWVKALDWAGNTQNAINQANMALDSCIEMLDYIGQGHWWCPNSLRDKARAVAPGLRKMKGQLAAPIREAVGHIKAFLEEMLGEHATAVVMAVASNAGTVRASGHPGAGQSKGHPSAPHAKATPHVPVHVPGTPHKKVAAEHGTAGKTTTGKIASATQRLAYDGYKALNFAAKGLMGEHIADHHIIEHKGWGLQWNRHDMVGGTKGKADGWQSAPKKLNDQEKPLFLCIPANVVLNGGIDSAWLTSRAKPQQFAIVEAKANFNPAASLHSLLGEAQDKSGAGNSSAGSGRRKKKGAATAPAAVATPSTPTAKPAKAMTMQMSHQWIVDRIKKDFGAYRAQILSGPSERNYSRHVFLVTPIQAAEHTIAIGKIMAEGLVNNPSKAQKYAEDHAKHDVQREFSEADLDAAQKTYETQGKHKTQSKKKPGGNK